METRSPLYIGPPWYGESYRGRPAGPHRSSTPLDILRMGVARWTFVLGCVWLGHRVITNHVCAQAVTRSYPRSIENGEFTLIIKDWKLRSYVTSDACEGGGSHLGTGF